MCSKHSILRYTALKFQIFLLGSGGTMSVRVAEGVSAQVPADDFQALEEKVYRTIELYKSAREAQAAAERDTQRLRQQLEEREEEVEGLRRETIRLRKEREENRGGVAGRSSAHGTCWQAECQLFTCPLLPTR